MCSDGPILDYKDNLKCTCVECGQLIGYTSVQVGRICTCPKCGQKSRFPGPESEPKSVSSSTSPKGKKDPQKDPLLIPGDKLPPLPRSTIPITKSGEPAKRRCPECDCPLTPEDVKCPVCERQRNKQRAALAPVAVVAAVVIAGVVAAAVTLNRARAKQSAADPHQNTHSAAQAPTPQPKVIISAPKSLNDLKIRTFAIRKQPGSSASTIVGDIENDSENRHRRITVELQVFNAQGMKIETLTATVADLAPHATWHVTSKTLNSRAASVRVGALGEE
jgi:DNA-directed RNA polymerase subunit M/transcription elongation factor TFIIS